VIVNLENRCPLPDDGLSGEATRQHEEGRNSPPLPERIADHETGLFWFCYIHIEAEIEDEIIVDWRTRETYLLSQFEVDN